MERTNRCLYQNVYMFIPQNFRVIENRGDPLQSAQFLASSNIIDSEFRRNGVYRERHLPGGELREQRDRGEGTVSS